MAHRLAVNNLKAVGARPQTRTISSFISAREFSSTPSSLQQPTAERASEIIEKLPSSPGIITKTGTAVLGTGLLAAAISQELYVMNEETVLAIGSFILFGYIAKVRIEHCKKETQTNFFLIL